jgi:hypothetical protein
MKVLYLNTSQWQRQLKIGAREKDTKTYTFKKFLQHRRSNAKQTI